MQSSNNRIQTAFNSVECGNLKALEGVFPHLNKDDLNKQDNYGYTMLALACFHGHTAIVEYLLGYQHVIDINKGYETPLQIAVSRGHIKIAQMLVAPSLKTTKEEIKNLQYRLQTQQNEYQTDNQKWSNYCKQLKEQHKRENVREKREIIDQRFDRASEVFNELCSLNEKVNECRNETDIQFEFIVSVSNVLAFDSELEKLYEKFLQIYKELSSLNIDIHETFKRNNSIENDEHVSHINNTMLNIRESVETINSEQYLIKLNNYRQLLGEKLQFFEEFKEKYLNQDYLVNNSNHNYFLNDKFEYCSPDTIQLLKDIKGSSGNSDFKMRSEENLLCLGEKLQTITNSLNHGNNVNLIDLSSNLKNGTEVLIDEKTKLAKQISDAKNIIPKEAQIEIYQIYVTYENHYNNTDKLIQETIPFIIGKHEQLQNIVNVMNNYKELSEQFTTLQRKKARLTRDLNVDKIKIDGLKEELTHITDKNELIEVEEEIKEKEQDLVEKKKNLKEFVEQINEIKLKFLQLKTIGFDIQSVLTTSIISNLNIEEMSTDLFKEIKPIHDFIGNHHLFIGIDINDKKHVIKQYTIKDNKKLESLKKELKITNKLKHFNIIEIEGFYLSSDSDYSTNNVYIVMPYYSNGNLKEFIEKQRKSNKLDLLFWERTWRQLLIAIQHIHSKGVIHCDIKPENIFVGELNNGLYPIILGDFDISLDVQSRTMNLFTRTAISGTYDYLAPELMNNQSSATFKSDMFAFGKTIKNCMTTEELTNCSSLNNLVEQCLKNDADERPFASDALVCDFFLNETLLDEVKVQQQVKSISNQSKQLKEFEQQLNQLKSNMSQEKLKLKEEIKILEKKTLEFNNQNTKERNEISNQISKLKNKKKKLKEMEKEMEQSKSRQLNIILPSYWKRNTFESFTKRYYFVDVTKHLQNIMQEIINISCNSTTLGKGRDQQVKMKYSQLIVSSVSRIENATLFTSFKSRTNHLASYQDPLNSLQVQTEKTSSTSKSFEWMKTVGLNSSMNEKYLWHGTKPEFVQTIAEHGFDERVACLNGLFGAGVYFAEYCSKSDQYCTPDQNDEYTLLLCRVVLGRQIYFTPQGLKNQRRPPEINNSNKRVYDSVVGQSNSSSDSYRELIVYDRYQCYPEYIIKYKRQ